MLKRAWDDKIIFGWVVFVLLPLIALEIFYAARMSGSLEKLSIRQAEQITKSLAGMVEVALNEEMKIVSLMAADDLLTEKGTQRPHRRDEVGARLKKMASRAGGNCESIFLTDEKGVIVADSAGGADRGTSAEKADYFIAAREGRISLGQPFKSSKSGRLVSVIGAPVYSSQGKFAGVIGAVVKLDFLLDKIAAVRIGESGYSFVADRTGLVLAHSDKENVLRLNIKTVPGMEGVAGMIQTAQGGSEAFPSQGGKKIATYTPVELTGWSICVVQDAEDVIVLPRSARNNILLTGGILLIIAVAGAFYFPRRLSRRAAKSGGQAGDAGPETKEAEEPFPGTAPATVDPVSPIPRETAPQAEPPSVVPKSTVLREPPPLREVPRETGAAEGIKKPFDRQNHYEVLDIPPNATPFEIRQAYKAALQIYQASSLASYSFFSDEERGRILSRLEEAYLTLMNNEARAEYDGLLVTRGEIARSEIAEGPPFRKAQPKPVPVIVMKDYKDSRAPDPADPVKPPAANPVVAGIMEQDVLTGADLKRLRTELGISLKEIAGLTRVRIGLLHAIEEDQFDQVSSRLHLESFLKAYAHCLHLDAEKVVSRYMKRTK